MPQLVSRPFQIDIYKCFINHTIDYQRLSFPCEAHKRFLIFFWAMTYLRVRSHSACSLIHIPQLHSADVNSNDVGDSLDWTLLYQMNNATLWCARCEQVFKLNGVWTRLIRACGSRSESSCFLSGICGLEWMCLVGFGVYTGMKHTFHTLFNGSYVSPPWTKQEWSMQACYYKPTKTLECEMYWGMYW